MLDGIAQVFYVLIYIMACPAKSTSIGIVSSKVLVLTWVQKSWSWIKGLGLVRATSQSLGLGLVIKVLLTSLGEAVFTRPRQN